MPDEVSVAAVEEALRLAATSMDEQLTALDEAIAYHDNRARELRETRRRVKRVSEIVNAPAGQNGAKSASAKSRIGAATKRRHAEERLAKERRVRDYVEGLPADADVVGAEVAAAVTDPDAPKNDPARISRGITNDFLRAMRDDGLVRVDRVGAGGQVVYRKVAT